MENRISKFENRRGGEPQRIGDILAELLAQYEPLPRSQGHRRRNTRSHGGPVMLVLSRRNGESIVIDGRITVTVVEIRGGQIRLGIEAPREVSVRREEVVAKGEVVAA